jgi:hypothetical protein
MMRSGGIAAMIWLTIATPFARAAVNETAPSRPAEALYLQLGQISLDPARVYKVRGASIERSAIQITLEDGTIAFTQDVMGHITGAFFEGDGEILLSPPTEVERRSMSIFTDMAILEERFSTAYFRFNDDTANELRPDLRAADDAQEFFGRWNEAARNLATVDAMRLLMSFSRLLPAASGSGSGLDPGDRMLHGRLQGRTLGIFDVFFDSLAAEKIAAGQTKAADNGNTYYDVWTSFSPATSTTPTSSAVAKPDNKVSDDWIVVRHYAVTTDVMPPKQIHAQAHMQLDVLQGGQRAVLFELSRFLQIEKVEMDGQPVEFIHNPAMEGTQLSRRGNDVVAVILPEPARKGQKIELQFNYGGEVLAEAGSGLLYVGERGTWYPNRGMAMSDFDLEFLYPQGWTLVATGKPTTVVPATTATGGQSQRWVSERPIPVAGFNLGKYKVATAQAGDVVVATYAAAGVEKNFPSAPMTVIQPNPADPMPQPKSIQMSSPSSPSPVRNAHPLTDTAARAIEYYSERFGPYPYSRLSLTQMPGTESQGWPGLVFLSSYAFLNEEDRAGLHFSPLHALQQQQIAAHETAHQWWGDLVTWKTYHDQWFSEGLANYCALMMLQEKNPAGFRQIMEKYREDLVEKNKDGKVPKDAGPVTMGVRLLSSRFPGGYEAISYGRGTWLFHMLRTMLQDAAASDAGRKGRTNGAAEDPFVVALRKVRERYQGKSITTSELLEVFAEDLPPSLRYEGKKSLDWFLQGWVNGTALPKLELKAVKFTPSGGHTVVSGTILQKDAPEDLVTSIPVYGVQAGRQMLLGRVFVDGEESSFRLTAPSAMHKVVLDPNATILTGPK